MNGKRVTIYDLAKALGISASYVSRALNNHPSVNKALIETVKKKALELNYRHNSHAANLRQGSSKTVGVIVPHINQSFFSEVIAGIEEVCFENNHSLIICQSHESFKKECIAIETLIHQNVDCIFVSISAETHTADWLQEIINNNIQLVQFDRCLDSLGSFKVVNNNREASHNAVMNLVKQGYQRIAFIGGPDYLSVFKERKEGYLDAIKEADLSIPYNFITDNDLSKDTAVRIAAELLALKQPPDAFFTVSDHQSLGVLQVAQARGIKVPEQLGIFGFANEAFTEMIHPTLSSIDQKSKELGKCAANIYFQNMFADPKDPDLNKKTIIQSDIIVRESSQREWSMVNGQ